MISVEDYLYFVDEALDDMSAIVSTLGDELANRRPDLPEANSPYAILYHCLGVMEYWAGYLVAGREIHRDRPAEFRARGSTVGLLELTAESRRRLLADLADFDAGAPPRGVPDPADAELPLARTQGGALLHLFDELARHRGQMELTRDLLLHLSRAPG